MRTVILALAILCGLFSSAEARPRRAVVAHPECNVTMPCIGVETSARGERVVRAMGGFGTATKVYRQQHSALHPPRYRLDSEKAKRRIVERVLIAAEKTRTMIVQRQHPAITTAEPVALKSDVGPRPGRWCGWFMQHDTGVTSKATGLNLNRAIEWQRVGQPTQPGPGAIVVWRHHVGKIVGGQPGRWVVRSGNDGGRVRERVVSLRGVVAFRSL